MRKSLRLNNGLHSLLILHRSELKKNEIPVPAYTVLGNLDKWLLDPLTRKAFSEMVGNLHAYSVPASGRRRMAGLHHQMKSRVERAFLAGDLIALRIMRPMAIPVPITVEAAHKIIRPSRETKKTTWVEIELVDEEGKPVPGERYRIRLPDGAIWHGTLNEEGRVRLDGIEPGNCRITFPRLDTEAWEPA